MASHDFDLGVIGAGAAGLTVTSGAAQLGFKTLLIEKEPHLGGDCLHYGCVPSKTLIKTAHVYHLMKNGPQYGLPALNPGPVDFTKVTARIKQVISTIQAHDSVERFCGLGAEVRFGQPAFVDEHSVDLEGQRISAKTWVIATGSRPAPPPIPGFEQTPFLTNKEIFSLDRLPESLLVVGAGPIASEMAQAFARLGSRVTMVQRSGQILSKEDKDMAGLVMARLQAEGVEILLNTNLVRAQNSRSGPQLVIQDGEAERTFSPGAMLVALGRAPNVESLDLERAGVNYGKQGIEVNTKMRTSQKNIFACGDVIGGYQFTHAAGYEGGIVVANALLHLPRKASYTWMPWTTYCDPELASVGLNEKAAQKMGAQYTVWEENFQDNDRSLAEGEGYGKIKMLVDKKEKAIGVQIAGLHAGELINEWVAVLNGGVKLSTLAGAVHPYPTLSEISKRVASDLLAPKLFNETVKKMLRFFFHTKGRACTLED